MVVKKDELPEVNQTNRELMDEAEERLDKLLKVFYNKGERKYISPEIFGALPEFLYPKFFERYEDPAAGWKITTECPVGDGPDEDKTYYYIE